MSGGAGISRGSFKAMLDFLIKQASGPRYALRAAVYEFNQAFILKAFAEAAGLGADVKIVYDARQVVRDDQPEKSKLDPCRATLAAIAKEGIENLCRDGERDLGRRANARYIAHNKFIVLLEDGVPQQVWTGSTNITNGGIFGQSNVGHIVRDPVVARAYLDYWTVLATDPATNAKPALDQIRPWNDQHTPIPEALDPPPRNSITPVFQSETRHRGPALVHPDDGPRAVFRVLDGRVWRQ